MDATELKEELLLLRRENAKLRDELDAAKHDLSVFSEEIVAAKAENAKLRELLSSYWKRVHSHVAPNVERDYLAEMHELGIEVVA